MELFTDLFVIVEPVVTWTFRDVIPVGLRPVIYPILDSLGIGSLSVLGFMFGVGITTFIAWQIATWILNIVT